jgi:hypothetical protein
MHQSGEERDDDELLARFADEQNDHVLFIGWYDYAQATQSLPIEAHVHQAWYMALHPMKLNASHSPEPYEQLFPDLRSKPRAEQKRKPANRGGRSSTDHGGGERRLGTMR